MRRVVIISENFRYDSCYKVEKKYERIKIFEEEYSKKRINKCKSPEAGRSLISHALEVCLPETDRVIRYEKASTRKCNSFSFYWKWKKCLQCCMQEQDLTCILADSSSWLLLRTNNEEQAGKQQEDQSSSSIKGSPHFTSIFLGNPSATASIMETQNHFTKLFSLG